MRHRFGPDAVLGRGGGGVALTGERDRLAGGLLHRLGELDHLGAAAVGGGRDVDGAEVT